MRSRSATVEELRARHGGRYKWLVLLTVTLGQLGALLSATIANVALPELSAHFGLGQERAQWVTTAFMTSMTLSLVLTPWLLGRFGMRRTYGAATLLLGAGGVASGLSTDFPALVALRALEGLGAGILQPIPGIVIMRIFPAGGQGQAMGMFGLGAVLAPTLGPTIGGLLVEYIGWRSVFFSAAPLCAVALLLAHAYLPASEPPQSAARPLDWPGLAWISASTLCVLNGLVEMRGSGARTALPLLVLGLAGFVSFGWYQWRRAHPLLQVRLFAHRPLAFGALVAMIHGFAMFGSNYLLPVYMQLGLAWSPAQTGSALLVPGVGLALMMLPGGRLADRLAPRLLMAAGVLMLAVSMALMATVTPATAAWLVVAWIVIGRVGMGLVLPAVSVAAARGLAPAEQAQALSLTSFLRQFGGVLGVSLSAIVLEWRMAAHRAAQAADLAPEAGRVPAFAETFVFLALVSAAGVLAAYFMNPGTRVGGRRP